MSDVYSEIPVERIYPNPEQPRKYFDQDRLVELAGSIQQHGVIQPIEVEQHGQDYILHDGERRWRASKLAGLATIPAIVKPSLNGNGPEERLMRAAVANLQRDDMNPIEEGHIYRRFIEEHGYSVHRLSQKIGKTEVRISHRLLLTRLDPEIQELIASGNLHRSEKLANALLEIEKAQDRIGLARALAAKRLTLTGCLRVITRFKAAVRSRMEISKTPSLNMASKALQMDFDEDRSPTGWTMQSGLGLVPPWERVSKAAVSTCENCELRGMANQEVCGRCPAVILLQEMIEEVVCHTTP